MKSLVAVGAACLAIILPLSALAQTPVKFDAALQKRIGVRIAPLQAGSTAASVKGFAKVIDPSPLVTLLNDTDAAREAARISKAEADRTKALQALDNTVSKKVAEAAALQAAADINKLKGLRQRLGLEWGPSFLTLGDAALSQLSSDLVMGRVTLLRIDSPAGKNLAGVRAVPLDLPGGGTLTASVMGPARTADPMMKSGGLLARVSGPQAQYLSPGLILTANLPSSSGGQGVLVPSSALLRAEGKVWAYITKDNLTFARRPVEGGIYTPQGLVVASGFSVGDRAVTVGAAALYTAENATAAAGE
ncbi:hypothetical protein [Asticcacaulis sp.]|uniref:hypothetical protein n=1 Tax=Asticcacaulis sp. TaxID=1872648 RepID=UPI0031D9054C